MSDWLKWCVAELAMLGVLSQLIEIPMRLFFNTSDFLFRVVTSFFCFIPHVTASAFS